MLKFLITGLVLSSTAIYLFTQNNDFQIAANEIESVYQEFKTWQVKYSKINQNSNDEVLRFKNWLNNREYIQQSNDSTLGLNIMADLTNEEFRARYINYEKELQSETTNEFVRNSTGNAPSSINWVEKGAVAPVQDQGNCGSCWAFGSVGALEGLWKVTSGNLVKLSEQQLVSCDTGNGGCDGGLEVTAYKYTAQKGIQTGASYPYTSGTTGKNGTCNYNASDVVYKNKSSFTVKKNDVPAIVDALVQQPLSKGISAGSLAFQLYSGGVFNNSSCGTSMNHSVTLVAFSDDASTPYWTIKNSWGTGWGDKGYMNIIKGDNGKNGICGINMDSTGPSM